MKILLTSYNPITNEVHEFDRMSLQEYTAWVERGYPLGFRARPVGVGSGITRFVSKDPEQYLVFTATVVND